MRKNGSPRGVWLIAVLAGVCLCASAVAQDDKQASVLTIQLYCDIRGLITGNVGVLIGLLLVFGGIWSIVQGKSIFSAVVAIILGGLVTSMPPLVESFIQGTNALLLQTGIATTPYEPFNCKLSPEANNQIQKCVGKRALDVYNDATSASCFESQRAQGDLTRR